MLYFDYNEYIKEDIYFMLILDDALRSVIARPMRVKKEELNEDLMKELKKGGKVFCEGRTSAARWFAIY